MYNSLVVTDNIFLLANTFEPIHGYRYDVLAGILGFIMKKIKLTRGHEAIIDDDDFEKISQYKWHGNVTKKYVYAMHREPKLKGGKGIYLHRLIMNAKKDQFVDHISGNTLDCRKINLRICTNRQNQANSNVFKGKSLFKGVTKSCGTRWQAKIRTKNGRISLGGFATELEAAKAYDKKAIEIHGEFARINFPIEKELNK